MTSQADKDLLRLKKTFNLLDADGDGEIPVKDIRYSIALQPQTPNDFSLEEKKELLHMADTNRNDRLNFQEFAYLTTSHESGGSMFRRFLFGLADTVTPHSQKEEVHSYLSSYNCCPPPIFMILISLVEIGVFLFYTLSEGVKAGWFRGCGGCYVTTPTGNLDWGPLVFIPAKRQEAWRFVSYMLVHAGLEHLLGNVIIQLVLGIPLELVHKMWRIAPLYFAGVILGSLLQYSLDPTVILVGASGGVYALITAHLANTILNWSEMPFRWVRVAVVLVFVGVDVGHVIYRRVALGACDRVSYTAHLAGAGAGLLLGVVVLRNLRTLKWEKILFYIAIALFCIFLITTIVLTIVIQPYDKPLLNFKCKVNNTSD